MMNPRQQLEKLLCETPAEARARESSAFDRLAENRRDVVIFGAGRLGRKLLAGLPEMALIPVAFADNDSSLWGASIEGVPVLKPQDATARYSRDAVFAVAIWHPSRTPLMSDLLVQLKSAHCSAVPFPLLFWRNADRFLPYFFWDLPGKLLKHAEQIQQAFALLEDDLSRQTLVVQLQLRLHADFGCPGLPVPGDQYFPGLFMMSPDECFVDCGSYTGDSIQTFISQTRNIYRKIIAFEVDSAILPQLESGISDLSSRAILHKAAVGATKGTVHFAGDGIGGGRITGTEGLQVPSVRLDDALAGEHITFIKMDIEGAELQALQGAERVIRRDRPVLAVCGYHTPDHLWQIPTLLRQLAPDSLLFLRSHCVDGLDTVFYSVPPERAISIRADSTCDVKGGSPSGDRAKGQAI